MFEIGVYKCHCASYYETLFDVRNDIKSCSKKNNFAAAIDLPGSLEKGERK